MTVRLSLAIMHVPDDPLRRAMLARIERALTPDLGGVISFQIIRDTQRKGVWPTAKQAWMSFLPSATHHLVLQDDMLPCPHFIPTVLRAIEARSEQVINLFSMRKSIEQCRREGQCWTVSSDGAWGGSAILPIGLIFPFLHWCHEHIPENYKHDDGRLSLYLYMHGIPIWQTAPCLLEHIGAAQSTLGQSNRLRIARWYPAPGEDVREIDWTRGTENPVKEPSKRPGAWKVYDKKKEGGGGG